MPRYIAFLRAINVGGHVVKMTELCGLFSALGFREVESFIASGNVIFSAASGSPAALEQKIEAHLRKALGYDVNTFLRTPAEVRAIAAHPAFPAARVQACPTFCVGLIARPLAPAAARSLMALRSADDDFHVDAREVYWLSRLRQGQAKFCGAVFERTVKIPITFRGMGTVARLAAKYPS